jgi:hypothetical protein
MKIGSGHLLIGQNTASTARDQNFGTNSFGTIKEDNAKTGVGFCRENAGCQPGCPGAYDSDICMFRHE